MLAQEVARKYAQALFLSSREKNRLDTAFEQLSDLGEFVITDKTLLEFLTSPKVMESHKQQLVKSVFSERLDRLVLEFLGVLVDKKRITFLPEIIDEFVRLVEAENGIARVTVVTAVSLNDIERQNLLSALARKTSKKIQLEEKLDDSIIGGMIVIMYNEIIDGSVRHGLNLVQEQLGKVRVH